MDIREDQGTDGASIRPVSSLRSHFEALKVPKPHDDNKEPHTSVKTNEASEVGQPVAALRKSVDIPRSESPIRLSQASIHVNPPPPPPSRARAESPPKPSSQRPRSLLIHYSPQLPPAVTVESPKSPPTGQFHVRNLSRSPERIDTTPFAKVRELVSQHSSRSSTRPNTPLVTNADSEATPIDGKIDDLLRTTQATPRASGVPPPVNRAEKPKIPSKPVPLVGSNLSVLPDSRRPSIEAKTSPFSTPPDSDDGHSPVEQPTAIIPPRRGSRSPNHVDPSMDKAAPMQTKDPRLMGFNLNSTPVERKDPRMLGFSSTETTPRGDISTTPTRASTVSERRSRDPRTYGPPTDKPAQRHVSETVTRTPPPASHDTLPPLRQTPLRDARQFGFGSRTAASALLEETPPGLPPRRTGTEPPPRPSEESKKPAIRVVRQLSPPGPVDRSTKPAKVGQLEQSRSTNLTDSSFPPPPSRYRPDEMDQPRRVDSISSHAATASNSRSLNTKAPQGRVETDESDDTEAAEEPSPSKTEYPDQSHTNRRPPRFRDSLHEMATKSDARAFDVCGHLFCTAGHVTRVFDTSSGEQVMGLNHGDNVKVLSVRFKPGQEWQSEGSRLWIGNNIGEIHEIDIETQSTIHSSTIHNKSEVVRILRHKRDLWTLDDDGKLFVWLSDESRVPSLQYSPICHPIQKGHTFSMVIQDKLWLATGKEIRVYQPGNEMSFAPLTKPLVQPSTGDITSGTLSKQRGGIAYFGHTDGKVTLYSTKDYSCLGTVKASDYKINSLTFVGDWLWAAYRTGKIYIYDTTSMPWKVKKDWRAHEGPTLGMILDPSSFWTLRKVQVTTVGHDNYARIWDGMLEDDWMDSALQEHDAEYCSFRDIKASVVSWNVGASSPSAMRGDFLADAIHAEDPPEILAFGFQEVVDLEDRTVTAKSILGFGKSKKDTSKTDQYQSRVYREWRDYLSKCVNRYTNDRFGYTELMTKNLIGLFQCILIRQSERQNIRNISAAEVKCGLKGHYGNKGALITRFILDDSSLCFINCHLAAGQSHTSQRNNDVATILESECLLEERDAVSQSSLFVGGGDGTQVLDHEICLLNGDLNYRIDTIPRDTVINMIKRNDLTKLLERDQILVSRRRVSASAFRLSAFTELPITFAPTYKYDINTDNYDSSDKKRSPAWCDRILYRGHQGRVRQIEYRRHDGIRVSDHRPVSGMFKLRVKSIDDARRDATRTRLEKDFAKVQKRLAEEINLRYLVEWLGFGEAEARRLIAQRDWGSKF